MSGIENNYYYLALFPILNSHVCIENLFLQFTSSKLPCENQAHAVSCGI